MEKNQLRLMTRIFAILLLVILVAKVHAQQQDSLPMVPGARLQLISSQFTFTEGAAVDKAGNIFFTDQPNDKIWEYDTSGKLSVFLDKTHRANGMYFNKNGDLVACADETGQLVAIDSKKRMKVLLQNFNGHQFNGPNDLWIDARGGIYFTDPYYQRDYWTRKQADLVHQSVYYLPANGRAAKVVDSILIQPNGIVGTADGKFLYVSDIGANKTYRYTIGADGQLSGRTLFVNQGSDGMTLDIQGNLYLCGKGVTVYDLHGTRLGNIAVPAAWVGNICFGGRGKSMLFITASESIYTLRMTVSGVE